MSTDLFESQYSKTKQVVRFDSRWNSGSNRFFYAVQGDLAVRLEVGGQAKSVCPITGIKLLFTGTPLGTVVVFERYDYDDDVTLYFATVSNELAETKMFWYTNDVLSYKGLVSIIGDSRVDSLINCGVSLKKLSSKFTEISLTPIPIPIQEGNYVAKLIILADKIESMLVDTEDLELDETKVSPGEMLRYNTEVIDKVNLDVRGESEVKKLEENIDLIKAHSNICNV